MIECPECLGDEITPRGEPCPVCNGRGLLHIIDMVCESCGGLGNVNRFRCPVCRGDGMVPTPLAPTDPPLIISAEELVDAYASLVLGGEVDDERVLGVICGLHAAAVERYPDNPDARADWLVKLMNRGCLRIDLDGIWHIHGPIGVRIVSFAEGSAGGIDKEKDD